MKAGLARLAILMTLGALAAAAPAHARSVIIKRTVTTTVTTKTVSGTCPCVARHHTHRRILAARFVPRGYLRYWTFSSYWTFTPPWVTSLAAAPYE